MPRDCETVRSWETWLSQPYLGCRVSRVTGSSTHGLPESPRIRGGCRPYLLRSAPGSRHKSMKLVITIPIVAADDPFVVDSGEDHLGGAGIVHGNKLVRSNEEKTVSRSE